MHFREVQCMILKGKMAEGPVDGGLIDNLIRVVKTNGAGSVGSLLHFGCSCSINGDMLVWDQVLLHMLINYVRHRIYTSTKLWYHKLNLRTILVNNSNAQILWLNSNSFAIPIRQKDMHLPQEKRRENMLRIWFLR